MRVKHTCTAHWHIDNQEVGICIYFHPGRPCERNGGSTCPYNGVKDFGELQRRLGLVDRVKSFTGGRHGKGVARKYRKGQRQFDGVPVA